MQLTLDKDEFCGWVHHLYSFMKVEKSCKRGSDVLITFSRDGGSNVSPSVGTDLLSSDPRILHMQAGIPFESTRRLASPHNKHISPFSLWNPFVFDLRHHGQHKEPIVSFCENSKAQNCEAHPPKCCHNAWPALPRCSSQSTSGPSANWPNQARQVLQLCGKITTWKCRAIGGYQSRWTTAQK
jgi:hypothetical protein